MNKIIRQDVGILYLRGHIAVNKKLRKKISDGFFTVVMIIMGLFPLLFVAWLCLRLVSNLA